jgi:beta-phosphoglucomutase-like phosphatase (HAD superfamily)
MTLIADCDYSLVRPPFTNIGSFVYRISTGINQSFTESVIRYGEGLFGGAAEHLVVSILQRAPLPGTVSTIVNPATLADVKDVVGSIGVYSIRSERAVRRDLSKTGLIGIVDTIACPENVGWRSFIRPRDLRRECIVRCMEELHADPRTTILVSDGPEDHRTARELGIAVVWGVETGYYKTGLDTYSSRVFGSMEEALSELNAFAI